MMSQNRISDAHFINLLKSQIGASYQTDLIFKIWLCHVAGKSLAIIRKQQFFVAQPFQTWPSQIQLSIICLYALKQIYWQHRKVLLEPTFGPDSSLK